MYRYTKNLWNIYIYNMYCLCMRFTKNLYNIYPKSPNPANDKNNKNYWLQSVISQLDFLGESFS